VRNRLFPKTRSWFALDAPLALLSPLSVLRMMFALAAVTWTVAAVLWPPQHHRTWVVVLSASALVVWVALLEVRRIRVAWCAALAALWIAQVSVLVWSGLGSGLSLSAAAFYVPVGVFVALYFGLRAVVVTQVAIGMGFWIVRMGTFGNGRAAYSAVVAAICLSTAPFTVMLFNKSIRRLGTVDPETGLPNGLGMAQRLEKRDRASAVVVVSVLVRGVDSAREALGYQAGTELLRRAIEDVGQVLPSHATIGRAEADELVVAQTLEGVAADGEIPQAAIDAATNLVGTIERTVSAGRYAVDGVEVALRIHAGIAIAPWNGEDARELLRRASLSAKHAWADRATSVSWLAEGRTLTADDLAMLAELGGAADRRQLKVVFQPQVDARSGAIVGAEALLRWHSPTRGDVPPGVFIPLAERVGLIDRLTEWILPNALDAQADWRRRGLSISTSVNLSPVTLTRHDLVEWIGGELAQRGLPPDCLTLEITETAVADLSQAISRLGPLRAMGIKIAVDDFGSGYTSLSQLPGMPLDELKVDQQFVRRSPYSPNDLVIVRTVLELAQRLGLVAVAEGVETDELARHMAELGYDVLQGFFAARPMPGDQLFETAIDTARRFRATAHDLTPT
jgi:EAL domain-containing protein (putative c-di-GMP-specific phosphodiesterase class I)/GGDEF domain-containing protein